MSLIESVIISYFLPNLLAVANSCIYQEADLLTWTSSYQSSGFPIVGNACIDDDDDGKGDGHDNDDDRDILPQTVKLCFCLPPQV